eukprot:TRINITY_DN26917_c0_g1_i2.p1 TRINITY_DN26917_c0_g1~~TRINITY_DN26917_c0_g1_i2.p1  ORF type:complete len:490 (-),score=67.69 TRINITY_DN26917_c0_g1_i2:6-1475(-)
MATMTARAAKLKSSDDLSCDTDEEDEVRKSGESRFVLPIVFFVFVVVRALDRVFLYRVQKVMARHTAVLMSLYWPPMVQCMCFFVCLTYVLKKRFVDGDSRFGLAWFSPLNPLASTQGVVPMIWVAQFSFWDQLNAVLSAPPSPFIPLVLQTPLNNTVVMWTALIAFFYLHTRFKSVHYAGICLILAACFSGIVVELQGPPDVVCSGLRAASDALLMLDAGLVSDQALAAIEEGTKDCVRGLPPYTDARGNVVYVPLHTLAIMYGLYLFAVLPVAFVNCYKQKKLKQVNLDVMWSFFWAGMWQVVWGIGMYPLNWLPYPTPDGYNQRSPATLFQDLSDSWTCFLGSNPSPLDTTCSSEPAYVWFVVYLLFNVFYNLLFLWLIKRLSGTWASIGSILCGNLCGIFGQYAIFAGDSATPLSMEQWLALVLSSLAMWVYNVEDETDVHGASVFGTGAEGDHRYDNYGPLGLEPDPEQFLAEDEPMAATHSLM